MATINNYLKRHTWSNQERRAVRGYFTLATASVPRAVFPRKYVRGLPPDELPLILLARLAVDRRFAGRGLGHALISEAFRISLRVADEVGCRCITTDAHRDRISWYAISGVHRGLKALMLRDDVRKQLGIR